MNMTGWKRQEDFIFPPDTDNHAAQVWMHNLTNLTVLLSFAVMKSGEVWLHLSVSRPDRLPSWDDLKKVKGDFLGDKDEAFHMLPKKEDYVNLHKFCLHLWSPISAEGQLPNLHNIHSERAP